MCSICSRQLGSSSAVAHICCMPRKCPVNCRIRVRDGMTPLLLPLLVIWGPFCIWDAVANSRRSS